MRVDDWPESPIIVTCNANNVYTKRGISLEAEEILHTQLGLLVRRARAELRVCPANRFARARDLARPADCAPTPTARRLLLVGAANRRLSGGRNKRRSETRPEDVWAVLDRFAAAAPATLWREASTRAAGSSSIPAR